MVRNRDTINQSIVALDSKFLALENNVVRQFGIKDYKQLIADIEKHMGIIKSNLFISRNNDILRREIENIDKNVRFLKEAIDGLHPIDKYLKTIEVTKQSLAALEQAVDREPLEGEEIRAPRTN